MTELLLSMAWHHLPPNWSFCFSDIPSFFHLLGPLHQSYLPPRPPLNIQISTQLSPPQGCLPRMPQVGRSLPTAHLDLRSTACGVSAGRCLWSVSGQDSWSAGTVRVAPYRGGAAIVHGDGGPENQAAQSALQPHS